MKAKGVKVEAGLMTKSYCQWERDWLMTLSVILCPYQFVQYHFVRIPFCPCHFVRTNLFVTIWIQQTRQTGKERKDTERMLEIQHDAGEGKVKTGGYSWTRRKQKSEENWK